jgi:Cu2+-exporting ATPase
MDCRCVQLVQGEAASFAHEADALHAAAGLAAWSVHPLSRALAAASADARSTVWSGVQETPGQGLQARDVDGRPWRLGSLKWALGDAGRRVDAEPNTPDAHVWLACDGRLLAAFAFEEVLRPDARQALDALRADGVRVTVLTGDTPERAQALAARVGADDVVSGATPQGKLDAVARAQAGGARVAMVGDGINDAPVLARADVSIAMGSAAALAQARADVIVLANRIDDLVLLRDTAVRTMRVVRQNLGWAVGYNLASVPLALLGWLPPWLAGIGMAASSLLVVLNALRLARDKSTPAVPASSTRAAQTTAA